MTKAPSQRLAFNWGLTYSFRGLVDDQHGSRQAGRQAGMQRERERKGEGEGEKEDIANLKAHTQ